MIETNKMSGFTYQMQNNVYQVIYDILFCQILLLCNQGKIVKKYLKIEGSGMYSKKWFT